MSTTDANELYDEYYSIGELEIGSNPVPTPAVNTDTLADLQHRLTAQYSDSVDQLLAQDEIYLDSPWDAALLLTVLEMRSKHLAIEEQEEDGEEPFIDFRTHPVFVYRGQSSPEQHPPSASIERRDPTARRRHQHRMDVFGRVLARLWASADFFGTESASPEANDDGFRAMGRHYGIASSLLDFTVDPRVAVAFADHSNHYDAGETGVVYALPIHEVMREFGESTVKGVLPFPFDRRIYRQRGIFLDLSDLEATDLMDHYVQIRFPITHSFEVRRFDEPIDLLGRDEWLSTLVDWTEDVVDGVAQVDAGDDMDELCLAFTREHGYPHWAKTSRASPHLFDVADNVEHLLYNLVYRYIPERNGEIPDPDLYAWLIRQNPAVFEAIAYLWISMVHQLNPMRMANAKAVIDLLPNGYDSDLHLNVETRLQQVADEFDIDLR